MSQPVRRNGTTFRALRNIVLAAALGIVAVSLSQCRMVQDNVTGIKLTAGTLSGRSTCVRQCNDDFEAAMRNEERRHRDAERACGNRDQCRRDERRLHDNNENKIEDTRKDCKRGCYNEGGGHGGK